MQKRLAKRISLAIEQMVVYDEQRWHQYVPRPVDFVKNPKSNRFGVSEIKIEENLDFIVTQLECNEKIHPPWGESFYQGDLKEAYHEWIGVLILETLIILDQYNRIEK